MFGSEKKVVCCGEKVSKGLNFLGLLEISNQQVHLN